MLGTVLRTWEEIQDHLRLGSLIGKMKKKKKIRELCDTIAYKRRLETDWFPFTRPEEISPGLVSQFGLLE